MRVLKDSSIRTIKFSNGDLLWNETEIFDCVNIFQSCMEVYVVSLYVLMIVYRK